jgi:hypothetical protein
MGDKPGHKFRGNQWSGGGRGGGGGGGKADLTVGGMMSRKKETQAIWDSAKRGETDRQRRAREFEFESPISEGERTRIRTRAQAHRAKKAAGAKKAFGANPAKDVSKLTKKQRLEKFDLDYIAGPHYD